MESRTFEDPIIGELHRFRAEMMRECDFDLDKLFSMVREKGKCFSNPRVTKEQLDVHGKEVLSSR